MNFPVLLSPVKLDIFILVCITSESGLKYGIVSNLARIFEFLCGKMFNCVTFSFYYCLFSIFFMMLSKQLWNIKKMYSSGGLQKKSQSWRMGAPKNLRGRGCSKGMQVFLKGGLETPNKLCLLPFSWDSFTGNFSFDKNDSSFKSNANVFAWFKSHGMMLLL